MNTKLRTDNLKRISSSTTTKATEHCIICLGDLVDQCELQPCQHNNFDFLCLVTWLQQRANCPLCNGRVHQVRYELSEDGTRAKVYELPAPPEGLHKSDQLAGESLGRSASVVARRSSGDFDRSAQVQLPYVSPAIQRRRFVYRSNLYSLHVGSNTRQPAESTYRELFPQLFATDPQLMPRARTWLRRELRVFEFLNTASHLSHDGEPSNAEFLLEQIIAILKVSDIQDSSGQAENIIQEFIGRKNAQLLLHELKAWLRSPYQSLGAWDRTVQYDGIDPLPNVSFHTGREFVQTPNLNLKYKEPADARKPSPAQAWRLYTFKGDDIQEVVDLWERSVWLFGRDERVVDVFAPHLSCSGQHAALQFRYTARDNVKSEEHPQYTSEWSTY
ncbi:hypothetical protein GQ44DRAFT_779919 [Phaeosphaeriaceae sp. PMI808]|nr:hypothetical protein GQ44DRAFT_779919 [Phaeosphaeriaceae sp. PMI808]